jgi:hypothetical protein
MSRPITFLNEGNPVSDTEFSIIHAFEERKCHEDMMQVLDLAIRYAKVYIFS